MAVLKYKKQDGTYTTLTNIAVKGITPVQTTGTSTTDVMSQKAVTDELALKVSTSDFNTYSGSVNTEISGKADSATTLAGYGITDANINAGVITLGSNTITPLTATPIPTTYSSTTYTTGETFTSSEPIVYALVQASGNLTNQVCPVALVDGQQCNVIYMGSTTAATYTVTISTDYTTPTGQAISALTVPANGYVEINYINVKGIIFVRGI